MVIFKTAFVILSSTYIFSLCYQILQDKYFITGLACLYLASGIIAGKILYDRYQHVQILASLTSNPNVTLYANKIASYSASFLFIGLLVYLLLFLFKVNTECITAINIFVFGSGTLYLWMQCIITTYIATLFYDSRLALIRRCLANVSFPIFTLLTVFGIVTTFLPIGSSSRNLFLIVTTLCSYTLAAIFCIFIMSFGKDYEYFTEGIRSDYLIDDGCSVHDDTLSDIDSICGTQDKSHSLLIMNDINSGKIS